MPLKPFLVQGHNYEWLPVQNILAKDEEEAKEKFVKLWQDGMIPVTKSAIGNLIAIPKKED